MKDTLYELSKQMGSNTEIIESLLSGLLDTRIKYNEELESFEAIKSKAMIIPCDIEAKICLLTGGEYNYSKRKCKHNLR